MYDFYNSDTDYSDEYSDVEYNTLDPYDYDLHNFKIENNVEISPEDKLLSYIDNGDLENIMKLMPGLLKDQEEYSVCNGDKHVSENGDVPSDYSCDEEDDNDDDEGDTVSQPKPVKLKELLLKGGDTPLIAAATTARADIVKYILSLGVDVNYTIPNTNKCALLAITSSICIGWRYMINSWRLDAPHCLKLLIDAGANVRIKGFLSTQESGYTALHYAAQNNYWEMLELLIHAGADVDAMSNQRETALMIAASRGYVACCNILLLAGANCQLMDRSGSNAAYLAGIEGHKLLSDSICVFSGSAQHNVDLYKIWSQYVQKSNGSCHIGDNTLSDTTDHLSNTCIESFCLSLDAPYLVSTMKEQGITISDLKLMSESKLKEIGVNEVDIDKIMVAMQDINRNHNVKMSKISFEYGKPIKIVTILEMIGNLSEHLELVDTNLHCWYTHLHKKYHKEMVMYKSTIDELRATVQQCRLRVQSFGTEVRTLKDICNQHSDTSRSRSVIKATDNRAVPSTAARRTVPRHVSVIGATALIAISVVGAFIYKRIR